MTRQDKRNIWIAADTLPTVIETEARIREAGGWLEERDALENSDDGRVSRRSAVLAGIFGCIGSAAVVIAAIWWLVKRGVDLAGFLFLLAVWFIAFAVLNPDEAATGTAGGTAFYLWFVIGLAGFCSACVVAVAVLDRMEARK